MGLAVAKIQPSQFQLLHNHLISHKPPYRTMHMREARYRNKKRVLHYLHAMHAPAQYANVIEGMISGPGVFWHYELIGSSSVTQLNVKAERGTPADKNRIGTAFLAEILRRIAAEQKGSSFHPTYLPGQFYLRRKRGGMDAGHPNCQTAVTQGVLDARFVSQLAPWDLELLYK